MANNMIPISDPASASSTTTTSSPCSNSQSQPSQAYMGGGGGNNNINNLNSSSAGMISSSSFPPASSVTVSRHNNGGTSTQTQYQMMNMNNSCTTTTGNFANGFSSNTTTPVMSSYPLPNFYPDQSMSRYDWSHLASQIVPSNSKSANGSSSLYGPTSTSGLSSQSSSSSLNALGLMDWGDLDCSWDYQPPTQGGYSQHSGPNPLSIPNVANATITLGSHGAGWSSSGLTATTVSAAAMSSFPYTTGSPAVIGPTPPVTPPQQKTPPKKRGRKKKDPDPDQTVSPPSSLPVAIPKAPKTGGGGRKKKATATVTSASAVAPVVSTPPVPPPVVSSRARKSVIRVQRGTVTAPVPYGMLPSNSNVVLPNSQLQQIVKVSLPLNLTVARFGQAANSALQTGGIKPMGLAGSSVSATHTVTNSASSLMGTASSTSTTVPAPAAPPTAQPPTPPGWNEHYDETIASLSPYTVFSVDPTSVEHQVLLDMVSGTGINVTKIEQIVNPELWRRFLNTRRDMLLSKSDDLHLLTKLGLAEKEVLHRSHIALNWDKDPALQAIPYSDNMALLFHCTRSQPNLDAILKQGLDERVGNTTGLLGRGIYFADDPSKSLQYDGTGVLMVFAVLLGDCCSMDHAASLSMMVREPEKKKEQQRNQSDLFFDSIVARAPHEYVIYNRYQCCPMYLLHFQRTGPSGGWNSINNTTINSVYTISGTQLPPIAWIPNGKKPPMPNPNQDGWPCLARTIFKLMKGNEDDDEDEMKGGGGGSPKKTEESEITVAEKLGTLYELGFTDAKKNRDMLFLFNYDLDATINHLLDTKEVEAGQANVDVVDLTDSPPSPPASSSKNKLPSNSDETDSLLSFRKKQKTEDDELPSDVSDFILDMLNNSTASSSSASVVEKLIPKMEDCEICYSDYESDSPNWKALSCSHKVCVTCYQQIETTRTTMSGKTCTFVRCPFCQGVSGIEIGTCPNGKMTVSHLAQSASGYEPSGSICINYCISDGKHRLNRTAYLPNNPEGNQVLQLLQTAWDRRLCFTVGTSATTGAEDVVVWNIHHKTSLVGGTNSYGYPDPTYFTRVKQELKYYGIE